MSVTFELKDALIFGGWFFTIAGWFVTNLQANRRESRKETRSEVEACCKMADDLLGCARDYYTQPPDGEGQKALAAKIRFNLKRLIARCERLQESHSKFRLANPNMELMDALTGDDFDSVDRPVRALDDPFFVVLEAAFHGLMDELERGFAATFRGRWKRPK